MLLLIGTQKNGFTFFLPAFRAINLFICIIKMIRVNLTVGLLEIIVMKMNAEYLSDIRLVKDYDGVKRVISVELSPIIDNSTNQMLKLSIFY